MGSYAGETNPDTVRTPEKEKGVSALVLTLWVTPRYAFLVACKSSMTSANVADKVGYGQAEDTTVSVTRG